MKLDNAEKSGCILAIIIILILLIWALVSESPTYSPSDEEYNQDNQGCIDAGRGCL